MTKSRGNAEGSFILAPEDVQRLRNVCPDLDEWAESWQVEPADIGFGRQIVQVLTPFLLHLLDHGLARSTVRRHGSNLALLGGELIRRRYEDDEFARLDAYNALQQFIENDEGPLIWPDITESAQNAFDATTRKLNRFMRDSTAE